MKIDLDIPKGFEAEIRLYCSTCQEEVVGDDYKRHECEEWRRYAKRT